MLNLCTWRIVMDTGISRFRLGDFQCTAVSDGSYTYAPPEFPLPAALLFEDAPQEQLERVLNEYRLEPQQWRVLTTPYICLLVDTGTHRVLLDTGAGAVTPGAGKLMQNLRAAGVAPDDIDIVILTHAHPDHIGGNLDAEGRPAFPNARYVMWKDEWDFWVSGEAEATCIGHTSNLLDCARANLPPIEGQIELVDHDVEIVPGVHILAAHGHTPGHITPVIRSADKELLFISDLALHPIHLERPEWHAAGLDLAPEEVTATRRRLLGRAATEHTLVLAFHFPFPGLGYIQQKDNAWQWQPISAID
jgi:glyoxylase-like metal-dependent hydrolase (beta-lactamase superfamily II)